MYEKLIDMVVMEVLQPKEYFVWGMDYRVPVYHGLLDKKFLNEQRLSPTFKEESFARESMSIWTGSSAESWFNNNRLVRSRSLLQCDRKARLKPDEFYIIGVDVARYRVNTAITVVKVQKGVSDFFKRVVFIKVLHDMSYPEQALEIKKLIEIYHPLEVIIDGTGMGAAIADQMVIPTYEPSTGLSYDPVYIFNDEDYLPPGRKTPPESPDQNLNILIYNLKVNQNISSDIHANCYTQIMGGKVSFLAHERIVKEKLLATKKGQKMSLYQRREFLLPFEMTTRLMDELNNLRLKRNGVANKIEVEQISRAIPKDRFSSLEYALWRIKHYEDKAIRKNVRKKGLKDMVLFKPRGGTNEQRSRKFQ